MYFIIVLLSDKNLLGRCNTQSPQIGIKKQTKAWIPPKFNLVSQGVIILLCTGICVKDYLKEECHSSQNLKIWHALHSLQENQQIRKYPFHVLWSTTAAGSSTGFFFFQAAGLDAESPLQLGFASLRRTFSFHCLYWSWSPSESNQFQRLPEVMLNFIFLHKELPGRMG